MLDRLLNLYRLMTQQRPAIAGVLIVAVLAVAAWQAQEFRLDASSDSLVLENDEDLRYYRQIREQYGSDDFLVMTYQPQADLFSDAALDDLAALKQQLLEVPGIASATTLLDVPLINSPPMSLTEIQQGIRTLRDPGTNREMARTEFTTSELYKELIINAEGTVTAMLLNLSPDTAFRELSDQRQALQRKRAEDGLSETEQAEMAQVEEAYRAAKIRNQAELAKTIAGVRAVMAEFDERAELHLGGVPMIASDMIDFVASDIEIFGIGIGAFILLLLIVTFRQLRWVLIPAAICGAVSLTMTGFLGMMDWPVTVVSSNFISLALIITLSLIVHLIVRYRELQVADPNRPQGELIDETLRSKIAPSFYTAATTVVSFASLVVSDIRPVIDFGLMMVWGVVIAFVMTFLMWPTALAPFSSGSTPREESDITHRITQAFAGLIARRGNGVLAVYALLIIAGIIGISRITVENRFIDYFKSDTEIYQGMVLIDKELGGTTPLDVIIDAPQDFLDQEAEMDEFALPGFGDEVDPVASGESYWYNPYQLQQVEEIHAYLDSLPETGKVLSLATTTALLKDLTDGAQLNSFVLNLVYRFLPQDIREILVEPYLSEDGNQVRFAIRVIDSDPNLSRNALLQQVEAELIEKFDLQPEQLHLTGALVLYNNVLQSLVGSQVTTMVAVFIAILAMFLLLFRSLTVALIAVIPTGVAAGLILGLMGGIGIPLDIMTITIAAITIGIGVDNAIHYTHRFREELAKTGDPTASMRAAHGSVGRAMYYTSVIVTLGFSILALSNFIPSIYFGLFTGLAMLIALIANLTLLPLLLMRLAPR